MSIFGMIIALGLLIDNAIVMTGEVRRNRLAGREPLRAVAAAIRHLFLPLLSSTLTTVLSFLPILLLPGNAGDFVRSIGASVIVALAASFLIAVTVIAAIAGRFGQPPDRSLATSRSRRWRVGFGGEWLRERIRGVLEGAFRRPRTLIVVSLLVPLLGHGLASRLGSASHTSVIGDGPLWRRGGFGEGFDWPGDPRRGWREQG